MSQDTRNEYATSILEGVLNNECGAVQRVWADVSHIRNEWAQFCSTETSRAGVSRHTSHVAHYTPSLLEKYFSVILAQQERAVLNDSRHETLHMELIPVIFRRMDTIFPADAANNGFEMRVRQCLLKNLTRIFELNPHYIIVLRGLLLQVIQESESEVFVTIVHLVGECISRCPDSDDDGLNVLNTKTILQYFEALELVAYQKLSQQRTHHKLLKQRHRREEFDHLDLNLHAELPPQSFTMLIVAMTKIAARCPDLIPRTIECLKNLIKNREWLPKDVISRANEHLKLLRFPSICRMLISSDNSHGLTSDIHCMFDTMS